MTDTVIENQADSATGYPPASRRVVLDTNVLVSLYVFDDSRFAPIRVAVESGAWLALTRLDCLNEFRRVLGYPLFKLSEPLQQSAFDAYVYHAMNVVSHGAYELPRCSDRDDQKFLELARDGCANFLITADKALLKLARRPVLRDRFQIITPDAALPLCVGANASA